MSTKKSKAAERAERAAALLREQKRRERRRNLITGGVVVAVLAALVVVGILISRSQDVDTSLATTEAGGSDYGVTIGDPDAPHDLVIYEDFLCPACGQFEAQSHEQLSQLADQGNVYADYRPFNLLASLGDYSARAASAFGVVLDTSGPEVAKKFHDLLFADQPEEGAEPYPDADWLVEKAVEAGASETDVRPGIEEGATDFSKEATAQAQEAGVSSTPTIILDGDVFNGSVEELLNELQ